LAGKVKHFLYSLMGLDLRGHKILGRTSGKRNRRWTPVDNPEFDTKMHADT
jgi:hypothetical protein